MKTFAEFLNESDESLIKDVLHNAGHEIMKGNMVGENGDSHVMGPHGNLIRQTHGKVRPTRSGKGHALDIVHGQDKHREASDTREVNQKQRDIVHKHLKKALGRGAKIEERQKGTYYHHTVVSHKGHDYRAEFTRHSEGHSWTITKSPTPSEKTNT